MTKEKRELKNIKGMDKRYELKQLPMCNTCFLEYDPMGNNDEGICNVYLQHHPNMGEHLKLFEYRAPLLHKLF